MAGQEIFLSTDYAETPFDQAPKWSKEAIWYQIFVERFYNGDTHNDPKATDIGIEPLGEMPPKGWSIKKWPGNWYEQDEWEKDLEFNEGVGFRRYGGDLQGILEKLDYLQELGVTALYVNPINGAPSSHKYDAQYYHHVDATFGPNPEGDREIMATEDPSDPTSWQWTSADKLFLTLVAEIHRRGMRIIIDYSWNHTGVLFWAWQDVMANQSSSPYRDWYDIARFDDPDTPENEFSYAGWIGLRSLPELRKVDITTEKIRGKPYEGNMNEGAKQHIFAVTRRWLAPDGNLSNGVDGFRLDVADEIGLGFWRDFRKEVRHVKPDAYLVGEVWWEEFPEKLMDPSPYLQGDMFDAVMFYQAYRPARYFFSKENHGIGASEFQHWLENEWKSISRDKLEAMMNVSSSHDTPRLLSDFFNNNRYKVNAKPKEDPFYQTGKPDEDTYKRVRLYLVHVFTSRGAPHIWNGEEMGMWGSDDPDCRKPLWWPEFVFEEETVSPYSHDEVGTLSFPCFDEVHFRWYQKLIALRRNNPVLVYGDFQFLNADGAKLSCLRSDGNDEIMICFNLSDDFMTFDIPGGFTYADLLRDGQLVQRSFVLESLQAAVLKRSSL